jgi:hypothetical protein
MDAAGLAEGRFLSPLSLRKECRLAGPQEGKPVGLSGLGSRRDGGAARSLRSWPRSPGWGGEVDCTSAQQPPRLREHHLTKGADKILLGESGAANPPLRPLLRSSGGPAHENPSSKPMQCGRRRHASINGSKSAPETAVQFTPLSPGRGRRALFGVASGTDLTFGALLVIEIRRKLSDPMGTICLNLTTSSLDRSGRVSTAGMYPRHRAPRRGC